MQSTTLRRTIQLGLGIPFGVAIALLFMYAFVAVTLRHAPVQQAILSDTLLVLVNLMAAASLGMAAYHARARSRRAAIAWGALAIGQLVFAVGDILWVLLDQVFGGVPFPSVADVFYFSAYPLYMVGIGALCTLPPDPMERQGLLLDAGVVILASFLIFWNLIFGPMITAGMAGGMKLGLLLAYPTADMLLLWALLMLMFRRMRYRGQEPIRLLAAGCVAFALSDMLAGYQILMETYSSAGLADLGYVVGYLLYGLAGITQVRIWQNDGEGISRKSPLVADTPVMVWPLYLPYVWLGAAYLLLAWSQGSPLPMSGLSLVISVALIVGLVVTRQILALRDNMRLSHALRLQLYESDRMGEELLNARRDLERRVEERTIEFLEANRALSEEIQEHRRAQQALRESESRYRMITEHMSDTIWLLDTSLRTVFVSPSVERARGYTQAELGMLGLEDQVALGSVTLFRQVLYELLDAPVSAAAPWRTLEVELTRKDGSTCWSEVTITLVRDESGRSMGVLCAGRDISERRHLEAQVRQAQKMEAMGRLAGGVAHDFNNLLMVIGGYAQMVLETAEAGEVVRPEDAHEIVAAGERAAALTRQLLAFSRRQPMEFRVLNLNEVLAGMHKMLSRLIGDDVHLELDLAPDLEQIKADAGQMEQVVMNLAVNARDAMPRGGTLTLHTANVRPQSRQAIDLGLKPGDYVLLSVRDNGVGMDQEIMEHLFEPFFTTKEAGKGTGLGLSTTYGIVHQSGGQIIVHSAPEQGTTFEIYLPQVAALVAAVPSTVMPPGGSETVLVIEDRHEVRRLAARMLEGLGYHVLEAPCGADALTLVQGACPAVDLVLSDLAMPGMGGEETVQRMMAQCHTGVRMPRVLYMSGYPAGEVAPNHGTPFIQKPFTLQTLAHSVRDALDAPPG